MEAMVPEERWSGGGGGGGVPAAVASQPARNKQGVSMANQVQDNWEGGGKNLNVKTEHWTGSAAPVPCLVFSYPLLDAIKTETKS